MRKSRLAEPPGSNQPCAWCPGAFPGCFPVLPPNPYTSSFQTMSCEKSAPEIIQINHDGELLAIIIPVGYRADGIQFFTPGSFSQQLGYMRHPAGHEILPHDHNPVPRTVEWTQEVLLVRSGKIRLDIYAPGSRAYLESRVLLPGDVVLLAHGGHGFTMLEPSEMIEVKQGPYAGEQDKERFAPAAVESIRIIIG